MKKNLMLAISVLSLSGTIFLAAPQAHAQAQALTSDQTFAKDAASGGMTEAKLGELAQQRGQNPAVKIFGMRMQTDHSKADDQLKNVAASDNITLPDSMNRMDQATYNRLSKLSGASFDRAYASDMVKDHEKDIAAFKKEAANGQNPTLRQFASQTLPTLEEHLKLARQMRQKVDTNTNPSAKPAADTSPAGH